jgi:RimJ/RimL family protein N-acetyltransferase
MSDYLGINTDRLLLRSIRPDDAAALFKYRSDEVINRYQGWIPKTINDVHDFIENRISTSIDLFNTWYQFAIILRENFEFIGDIGIHFLDEQKKQVEIGCTLDINYHGKGFATEALIRVIDYVFADLNKQIVFTSIDPENNRSIALVERIGFKKETNFIQNNLLHKEWPDDIIYSIKKEEWIEKKGSYKS